MSKRSQVKIFFATLMLSAIPTLAWGQWQLDGDNSTVEFISTKNASAAESHSFTSLSGSIASDGKIRIDIALDSVETLIPIRNERMREMLFNTANFPVARVDSWVDDAVIKAVADGDVVIADVPITLSLHGQEKPMKVPVVLVGTSPGSIVVVTSRPIIINAADFDLVQGINRLREAAGLNSISTAVPVSFRLLFSPDKPVSIDS
jgi:polyisoprenoid-binding protein YceI